jgi:hypothetical protein
VSIECPRATGKFHSFGAARNFAAMSSHAGPELARPARVVPTARPIPTSGRKQAPAPDGNPADIEEIFMQTTRGNRYMSMKQIASAETRREEMRAPLKAAITGETGLVVLVLLLLVSVGYVVFGGAFGVASAPKAQSQMAALAAEPADAGAVARSEKTAGSSAAPADYFPADYPNRGHDGDGNVTNYEHD